MMNYMMMTISCCFVCCFFKKIKPVPVLKIVLWYCVCALVSRNQLLKCYLILFLLSVDKSITFIVNFF